MLRANFTDGVPGLTQLPIQPGAKFVYKWTADHYGSYWYHAHNRAQVEDGLLGAIFVKYVCVIRYVTGETNWKGLNKEQYILSTRFQTSLRYRKTLLVLWNIRKKYFWVIGPTSRVHSFVTSALALMSINCRCSPNFEFQY